MWTWKHRPSRRVAATRRVRLCLEGLEERAVPTSLQPGLFNDALAGPLFTTIYTESNNPAAGQNAVLAFRQDPFTGSLKQIGTFATGGTGQINVPKVIGPDDSSQEVVATPDGRFLFAVNQGSNSITAFRIDLDGKLDRIGTFDSGGVQPDSIGISGDRFYVSNRGDSAVGHPGTVAPNITAFTIDGHGRLTPIANSTVTFPVDTSPSQNLISRDGKLLFADIFAVPGSTAAEGNTIAPFQIQANGSLKLAPGGDVGAPVNPPLLLGADTNPNLPILYAGLTASNQIAVFTYDKAGNVSFVGAAADQGAAPCWITVSADGKYLYAGNTGTNSVGVFSLADPLHPVEIQEFALGGPHAPPGSPPGSLQSNVFQLALSPDGRSLYAIGQNTSDTGTFPQGNQLHILSVGPDGKLSEPNGPILLSQFGVPGNAHPQGIAVVAGRIDFRHFGGGGDRDHGHEEHNERLKAIDSIFTRADAAAAAASTSVSNSAAIADTNLSDVVNALLHLRQQANSAG
ncbi:MAG TPA: beta-propeller fold lactonase family protein [Gemmataceae bacterium]|nr:beta-propeller fold lactonase family protein [Gemmataceae bacterium]